MMKQSTSFAQGATNLLNVLQGYTKGIRFLLVMFVALTVSAEAWGEDVTVNWTASSGALGSGIGSGTIKTGTFSWNYTRTLISGSSYTGWSSNCIQLGKNGGVENITFTTSAIPGTIKEVSIECASYQGKHNVAITVGGKSYLSSTATSSWTEVSAKSGSGTSSGTIQISLTGGTKALYIKSISVTYEEAATCTTNPTVSAGSHSNVTTTTATVACAGGITSLGSAGCSIESYGFVYGTSSNPTISNTKVQVGTTYTITGTSFSKELTGLTANATYYVRSYATNGNGTAYGTETSFKTLELPKYTVTLDAGSGTCAASVTETSAGAGVTLPTPTLDCGDWEFAGWATSSIAIETSSKPATLLTGTYKPTDNIILYAVYQRTEDGGGNSTPTSVTKEFSGENNADLKFSTGSSTNHLVNDDGYTAGDVNIKFTTGTNSNKSYYDGSVVRFYVGSSLILTPLNGVTITQVKFIRSSSTSSNTGTISTEQLTASQNNTSTNTNVFTGSTTSTVTFKNNAQCRFSAMRITYFTSSGNTTYYHSTPDCGITEPSRCLVQKLVVH